MKSEENGFGRTVIETLAKGLFQQVLTPFRLEGRACRRISFHSMQADVGLSFPLATRLLLMGDVGRGADRAFREDPE